MLYARLTWRSIQHTTEPEEGKEGVHEEGQLDLECQTETKRCEKGIYTEERVIAEMEDQLLTGD